MEKYYNINELSIMTGLTTRTLRNYIKYNILSGEKIEGIWKFSEENISDFILNPNVISSIQAKKKAIISDFLTNTKKKQNEICSIVDLNVTDSEAEEINQFFCNYLNAHEKEHIQFSYEKNNNHVRVILSGHESSVMKLLNTYYGGT